MLIGSNDLVATINSTFRRALGIWKRLPQEPSPKWYEENLRQIGSRLKKETTAQVVLCSLPVIGEDPESEVNRRVGEYSTIIRQIARMENTCYIPFYERMHEQIVASPGRDAGSVFLSMGQAAFKIRVLHKSIDEVGRQNGWRFHHDGYHLNSRGGNILADLVQEFVAAMAARSLIRVRRMNRSEKFWDRQLEISKFVKPRVCLLIRQMIQGIYLPVSLWHRRKHGEFNSSL